MLAMASLATAAEEGAAVLGDTVKLGLALGSGLSIGLAALGGGIGQGLATAGALGGMARNPGMSGKITTWMLIGLAMIESLVIYALVITFMMYFKL